MECALRMLVSMILGLAVLIVAWRVGGVRKRLELLLLGITCGLFFGA